MRIPHSDVSQVTDSGTPAGNTPPPTPVPALRSLTGQQARYVLTSWIGRDTELAGLRARAAAPTSQVLTITGPVGVGKSRLAAALLDRIAGDFADGGHHVELDTHPARTSDPAGPVAGAVLEVLEPDIVPGGGGGALSRLCAWLRGRDLLLVLDCGGRPPHGITELWQAAAAVTRRLCLVTVGTRVLGMYGEHRVPLLPLAVPTAHDAADLGRLARVDSVRLLVDRTQAVRPGFQLTQENRETVAGLCRMLDGLPMSIEQAASRLKVSSPHALLGELASAPGAPPGPAETDVLGLSSGSAALLARLGVLTGTFAVTEAAAVVGLPLDDTLRVLEEMVDHSALLTEEQRDGSIRFRMLRRSRARALEYLREQNELETVRAAHAAFFAGRAGALSRELEGPGQAAAIARFGHWRRDVSAAVEFLLGAGEGAAAARLAAAAQPYWLLRGETAVAVRLLSAAADATSGAVRLAALEALGEALLRTDNPAAAGPVLDEALTACTSRDNTPGLTSVRPHLARLAQLAGDPVTAENLLMSALTELGPGERGRRRAGVLARLAEVRRDRGSTAQAARDAAEAVRLFERAQDARSAAGAQLTFAGLLLVQNDAPSAERLARQALSLLHERGDLPEVARGLVVLTEILTHTDGRTAGVWERAARLLGAAGALRERAGDTLAGQPEAVGRGLPDRVEERLGRSAFIDAWEDGARYPADKAVALALAPVEPAGHPADDMVGSLTRREHEVAMLVTEGLTNREVARRLGIAEWTTVNHMRKVMQKLGCTSRVQVAGRMLRPAHQDADPVAGG